MHEFAEYKHGRIQKHKVCVTLSSRAATQNTGRATITTSLTDDVRVDNNIKLRQPLD